MAASTPIEGRILRANDDLAAALRAAFVRRGALCLNFISSPGAGTPSRSLGGGGVSAAKMWNHMGIRGSAFYAKPARNANSARIVLLAFSAA